MALSSTSSANAAHQDGHDDGPTQQVRMGHTEPRHAGNTLSLRPLYKNHTQSRSTFPGVRTWTMRLIAFPPPPPTPTTCHRSTRRRGEDKSKAKAKGTPRSYPLNPHARFMSFISCHKLPGGSTVSRASFSFADLSQRLANKVDSRPTSSEDINGACSQHSSPQED